MLAVLITAASIANSQDAVRVDSGAATRQINYLVHRKWTELGVTPADRCSDRTFVRRVYLDLAGRVPTVTEVRTFLDDGRADRRVHLVDELLQSEDFVQHFADLFDTLLMGRTDEGKYAERVQFGWRSYLESVFRDHRPWNEVTKEILLARPTDPERNGAVWFLYERNNEYQTIAEAVSPAFFGVRIECAQCHDHMRASDIRQADYWGLVAFFNRGRNEKTPNGPRVAESAIGGFSEFANLSGDSSPNVLTFFSDQPIEEARPAKDAKEEDADALYVSAAVEHDPRIPKFSRREQFVEHIVAGHPLLARAMVNRLWAIMMARGIVHPFDEMDSVHPPSHPELLGWLSADFSANGHDIRHVVRAIAMSDAYQRDSVQPDYVDDPALFAWYLERPLTAEQMARSIQLILRGSTGNDESLTGLFRRQFREVLPDENVTKLTDALFVSNSGEFDAFIYGSTGDGHLIPQLKSQASDHARAELLFLTIFGRDGDENELNAVVEYLASHSDSLDSAIAHVLWAFLASAEFRFNH